MDPEKVSAGKKKELDSQEQFGTFTRISRQQAKEKGLRVIRSRWVLCDRGETVKARLVACDVAHGRREDVWAGTPTSTGQKLLLYYALARDWQVSTADVATAFLNAPLPDSELLAIEPPPGSEADRNIVWECHKALYGFRTSPSHFQEWFATQLTSLKWRRSVLDPCLYIYDQADGQALLSHHVDDILLAGTPDVCNQLWLDIEARMRIKRGPILGTDWQMFLGRQWRRGDRFWELRMKPGYYSRLIEAATLSLNLPRCRAVQTPKFGKEDDDTLLLEPEANAYRTAVGNWRGRSPADPISPTT